MGFGMEEIHSTKGDKLNFNEVAETFVLQKEETIPSEVATGEQYLETKVADTEQDKEPLGLS